MIFRYRHPGVSPLQAQTAQLSKRTKATSTKSKRFDCTTFSHFRSQSPTTK